VVSLVLAAAAPCIVMFGGIRPYTPIEKKVDAGTFAITVGGRRAGRETFEIVQVGLSIEVRTRATVALPAGQTTIRGTLRADLDWKPRSGTFDTITGGRTTRVTLQQRGNAIESTMTELPRRAAASFTRPSGQPDLYFGSNVIAHLTPLCRAVDAKERALSVFPAAPLKIASSSLRRYPLTNLGAPGLELTEVVADLAQSVRINVLCDGTKLLAAHLSNLNLTAVRASFEELASVLEGRRRGKPILSSTVVELARKVRVGIGEAPLGCTLLLPKTHAEITNARPGGASARAGATPGASGAHTYRPPPPPPLPAALLLGGFGPQDRDGNSVGPGDFQLFFQAVLASKLGEAGIATLRCDDRGTGESAGDFKRVTLDTEARDTLAALAALRAEPAVDPTRVAVIGHGEGAIVAPMVAAKARAVRALALLAPPGRPLDAIVIDQQQWSMHRFGFGHAEIQARTAELSAIYAAVRSGKRLPDSLSPAERRGITDSAPWLRSHFRHAPMAEAPALTELPVFVAGGGRDVQISVADVDQTRDAFTGAGNKLVAYKVYPELNHLFAVSKTSGIGDYYDPMAEVDATFLNDVVDFVLKTTAAMPVTSAPAPAAHAGRRPAH
jgi:alpha-beta hydrolase superfamily lysophospholipase